MPTEQIINLIDESTIPFNTYDPTTNYNILHAAVFMKNVSLVKEILK